MKFKVGDKVKVIESNYFSGRDKGLVGTMVDCYGGLCTVEFDEPHEFTHSGGRKFPKCNVRFYEEECLELVNSGNKKIVITTDGKETLARLYEGDKVVKKATARCSPDDTFDFKTGANLAYARLMGDDKEPKEEPKAEQKNKYEVGQIYRLSGVKSYGDGEIEIVEIVNDSLYQIRYKVVSGLKEHPFAEGKFALGSTFDKHLTLVRKDFFNGKAVCVKVNGPYAYTVGKVYTFVNGRTENENGYWASPKGVESIAEFNDIMKRYTEFLEIKE